MEVHILCVQKSKGDVEGKIEAKKKIECFDDLCRGYGGFGALGDSVYTRELIPRLVEGPWDKPICHVSTSGTHTAAITESGRLENCLSHAVMILQGQHSSCGRREEKLKRPSEL
ncbi:hypothetical protein AgCh_006063 [Apium graveolens]